MMEWIKDNWQFLSALVSIIFFLSKIATQTSRHSKDILRLESEMKENKKESDETNKLLFNKLDEFRKESFAGFKDITDKLFGLAKDGRLGIHKD